MHLSVLLAALPLVPLATSAGVQLTRRSEPAPLHRSNGNVTKDEYIVKFKDGTHQSVVHEALNKMAKNATYVYDTVFPGFSKSLSRAELDEILRHPDVDYVEENAMISGESPSQPQFPPRLLSQKNAPWNLARIAYRQRGPKNYIYHPEAGMGTCVYVIDTGVDVTHTDFEGRAKSLKSFVAGEQLDDHGHGTHIAAIIGGRHFGVAKKTKLYSVKVLDRNNNGNIDRFIKGMDYVARHQKQLRDQGLCPKGVLVNMSFSSPVSKGVNEAAERLIATGAFVASSAGNAGIPAIERSPAAGSSVCNVGATDRFDKLYSDPELGLSCNYGARVDIFAPGSNISSAASNIRTGGGNLEGVLSGTSQAVPHVVGIAALLAVKEGLTGTKPLCDAIKQLATRGAITNQRDDTPNLLAYNGAKQDLAEASGCHPNAAYCEPEGGSTFENKYARPAVTTGEDPHACSHFKRLHIRLVTAGDIVAGTWDNININFGGKSVQLASSPYRNEVDEKDVDINKAFGVSNNQVRVADIHRFDLTLSPDRNGDDPDWWKLRGLTLVGTCAGSGRLAQITKFQELYEWFKRLEQEDSFHGEISITDWKWQTEDEDTETLAVQPPGRPDACSHFKSLSVELKVGSGIDRGTWDNVEVCFDSRPKCTIIAREPSSGFDGTTSVNLQNVFGSPIISAPGFRSLKVYSTTGANIDNSYHDWWVYDGITLRAECAGSPRVVEALKFSTRDDWVIREKNKERTEIASGVLAANEWKWIKKD